jgi:hypothetical protein
MKQKITAIAFSTILLTIGYTSFAGLTPGGGGNQGLQLNLSADSLNPNTFDLTLNLQLPAGYVYILESCEGKSSDPNPVWVEVKRFTPFSDLITKVDDLSRPLSTSGRTYRLGVEGPPTIYSNELFIPYPFMTNPRVHSVVQRSNNQVTVEYGEGIYTNSVSISFPTNASSGFFWVYAPENYPTNSAIQFSTNLNDQSWSTIQNK